MSADLDAALTLVDALDLMGAPVHATALGALTGQAVALLAVADHRVAGPHMTLHLREPRAGHALHGRDVEAWAAEHARQCAGCRIAWPRPADGRWRRSRPTCAAGRMLGAQEAKDYGLVDTAEPVRRAVAGPIF